MALVVVAAGSAPAVPAVPDESALKTHKVIVSLFILEVEVGTQSVLKGCAAWYEALRQLNPSVAARFMRDVKAVHAHS